MDSEIKELDAFNSACNEFVNGKFILFNMKLDTILKNIENDEKIKDIVDNCTNNFNFKKALRTYVTPSGLTMPSDNNELVAFVYSLLLSFRDNEIDFFEFLSQNFNTEDNITTEQYSLFAKSTILPFKNAINNIYADKYALVDSNKSQLGYYEKIKTAVKNISNNIDCYRLNDDEQEELKMLLNSMYISCEKLDKNMIFTLLIAFDYFTRHNKKSRDIYYILQECFE